MPAIRVLEYLDASGRSPLTGQDTAIDGALKAWPDYKRRKKG